MTKVGAVKLVFGVWISSIPLARAEGGGQSVKGETGATRSCTKEASMARISGEAFTLYAALGAEPPGNTPEGGRFP